MSKDYSGKWWVLHNDIPANLDLTYVSGNGYDEDNRMVIPKSRDVFFIWFYTKEELIAYYNYVYIEQENKLKRQLAELEVKKEKLIHG